MIKTIERKICDVCKKEVKSFAGSLVLNYSDSDYTGCGYPVRVERKEICVDCCRKLNKVIKEALKEEENEMG
ncbi:hypothetical protein [uncultured Treponema sp.]|jgi:hypothetical protein|uniref:hypothetical protein n=1 Tax=uncultured Treponema sp. TaxID=162155 RepID=UPI0025917278|nr:hypothetical protein [uncultured Treponema sp.]